MVAQESPSGVSSLQSSQNDTEKPVKDDSSLPSSNPSNPKAILPKENAEEHASNDSTKEFDEFLCRLKDEYKFCSSWGRGQPISLYQPKQLSAKNARGVAASPVAATNDKCPSGQRARRVKPDTKDESK
ncbi:hypothetical protein CDL15_Pgr017348 [Punica granatum]|uniref:Uncharacterized protein n=1 Tax=Punica granatum TaxID=22663 RepID=A0A218Y2Y1_PUNGR|nr:hypothetical protein CDL15_Pgr017348 [Punica granatum]